MNGQLRVNAKDSLKYACWLAAAGARRRHLQDAEHTRKRTLRSNSTQVYLSYSQELARSIR